MLNHLGRHAEALAAYERVIEIDPENAVTWSNKGITLNHLGRHAEAPNRLRAPVSRSIQRMPLPGATRGAEPLRATSAGNQRRWPLTNEPSRSIPRTQLAGATRGTR